MHERTPLRPPPAKIKDDIHDYPITLLQGEHVCILQTVKLLTTARQNASLPWFAIKSWVTWITHHQEIRLPPNTHRPRSFIRHFWYRNTNRHDRPTTSRDIGTRRTNRFNCRADPRTHILRGRTSDTRSLQRFSSNPSTSRYSNTLLLTFSAVVDWPVAQ